MHRPHIQWLLDDMKKSKQPERSSVLVAPVGELRLHGATLRVSFDRPSKTMVVLGEVWVDHPKAFRMEKQKATEADYRTLWSQPLTLESCLGLGLREVRAS